jgi:hypothetical protein
MMLHLRTDSPALNPAISATEITHASMLIIKGFVFTDTRFIFQQIGTANRHIQHCVCRSYLQYFFSCFIGLLLIFNTRSYGQEGTYCCDGTM